VVFFGGPPYLVRIGETSGALITIRGPLNFREHLFCDVVGE
jgi:hypothetical protein